MLVGYISKKYYKVLFCSILFYYHAASVHVLSSCSVLFRSIHGSNSRYSALSTAKTVYFALVWMMNWKKMWKELVMA
jgi:hypothetical protein